MLTFKNQGKIDKGRAMTIKKELVMNEWDVQGEERPKKKAMD